MSSHRFVCSLIFVVASLATGVPAAAAFEFDRQIGVGELQNPEAITVDQDGNVYVANIASSEIVKFDPEGEEVDRWGGPGTVNGLFTRIAGIDFEPTQKLIYATDDQTGIGQNRVQVFRDDGSFVRSWGQTGAGAGQFDRPRGIAAGPDRRIAVADSGNNRFQVLNDVGNMSLQAGTFGYGDGAFFDSPKAIDFAANGNLVVGDGSGSIRVFSPAGQFLSRFAGQELEPGQPGRFGALRGVTDLVVDSEGRTFALDRDNHRVQVFEADGDFSFQFGKAGAGTGEFRNLMGVAVGPQGDLYVTDTNDLGQSGRVQVFMEPGDDPGPPPPLDPRTTPARFKVVKKVVNRKKGTATIVVSVSTKGRIRLHGSKRIRNAAAQAPKPSRLRLVVRPKAGFQKQLRRKRLVKLKVRVTFTPAKGKKTSRFVRVTLRR